jgi:predicted RNA-binding Zn-ribbon protein involved in translation (DUF1610 family)
MGFPWKKLLSSGFLLIVCGVLIIVVLATIHPVNTVSRQSFDLVTKPSFFTQQFRSEDGDSLSLDISTSGSSEVHVRGQVVGEMFKVAGTRYQYTIPITEGDVYQIEIRNMVGHYENIFFWVLDDNHFVGSYNVKRVASYVLPLNVVGIALIGLGVLALFISANRMLSEKHKAEMSRKCPQCGQAVSINKTTCPYCGFDVTKSVRCKHCNALYDSSLYKCPNCGAKRE